MHYLKSSPYMVNFLGRCLELNTSTILPKPTTQVGGDCPNLECTLGMCGMTNRSSSAVAAHMSASETSSRSAQPGGFGAMAGGTAVACFSCLSGSSCISEFAAACSSSHATTQ